ncbi:MAG TPA: LamG-like jellyroll fold domain-containing protein, partial [Pirellulales bacterium]|nr:LamG-like jellyroll fold domain-containing protein [Pirellulales bacterium]
NQTLLSSGQYLANPRGIALVGGKYLVDSYDYKTISFQLVYVDPASGAQAKLGTPLDGAADDLVASPTGKVYLSNEVASGASYVMQILAVDPATGATTLVTSGGSLGFVASLATTADGSLLAAGQTSNSGGANPGQIVEIDPATGAQTVITSGGDLFETVSVLVEPNGDLLAVNGLFDPTTYAVVRIDMNPARNVISGNDGEGVLVGAGSSGNTVASNFIGANAAGTAAIANGSGVALIGASSNTVSGNVISGNTNDGVYVYGNSPATTGDLPGGLVGWWQADNNTDDSSGNNNNGAWVGTASYGSVSLARAVYGEAFAPTGASGQYVSAPDSASLDLTNQATMAAWISMNAAPAVGSDYVVLSKGPTATSESYSLYVTNVGGGDLELAVQTNSNGSIARYVSSGAKLVAEQGVFSDVAATLDGSAVRFYVDGQLVSQTAQTAPLAANAGPLDIGGDALAANNTFNGYIDDVQLYNQALTAAQLIPIVKGDGAPGNTISGNLIGTDATGEAALGNGNQGVDIEVSVNNVVGGTTVAARNVISANATGGVLAGMITTGQGQSAGNASGNAIEGNYIGADATGTDALGNGGYGVHVHGTFHDALYTTIGGTQAAGGNVISGNVADGIYADQMDYGVVAGNFIGTNAAGSDALPNDANGIEGNGMNLSIGGSAPGDGNVVSGNQNNGILIVDGGDIAVEGNDIGTGAIGEQAVANGGAGVYLQNTNYSAIGGTTAGEQNVIRGNLGAGVVVGSTNAAGNAIRANSIYGNSGLGIDLGGTGRPVLNDSAGHVGPNNFENFPIITAANATGGATPTLQIAGTMAQSATPGETFTLDFFESPTADPSGYGQGQTYVGSTTVTANSLGQATFNSTFNFATSPGQTITATATDAAGNTSEFSQDHAVNTPPTVSIVGATTATSGQTTVLASVVTDPDAGETFSYAWSVSDAHGAAVTLPASEPTSGPTLQFTPPASGSYTVALTVTDSQGGVGHADFTVVAGAAAPGVVIGKPQNPTTGSPVSPTVGQALELIGAVEAPVGAAVSTFAW